MEKYDVIIIGRGPAGLQAAVYTARSGLSTLVLGRSDGSLAKTDIIENYFGFAEPISGPALLEAGMAQAARFGAVIKDESVLSVDYSAVEAGCYDITCGNDMYIGKSVLIAVGKALPQVKKPGVSELEGKGVSYCATCDGFLYRGRELGVLGAGEYALHEAESLKNFTPHVTLYTDGAPLYPEIEEALEMASVTIDKTPVERLSAKTIQGEAVLGKIHFTDGTQKDIDGMFIALDRPSSADFARKLGLLTEENGSIKTDSKMAASAPGIYAAGDCCSDFKQIAVAVGQACIAAKSIISYVRKHQGRPCS